MILLTNSINLMINPNSKNIASCVAIVFYVS